MEKISKILAVTIDRSERGQGSGGNCKVVALFRDGKYIIDEVEISSFIETNRMIFSNKLYDSVPDLHQNELLEIIPSYINTDVSDGKNFYVSINAVKRVGLPVIDIPLEYLSEDYIDIDYIFKYLTESHSIPNNYNQIYLCDNKSIFGPFKITGKDIIPLKGRHTYSFEYDIDELIIDYDLQYSFLVNEPKTKIKSIDCSTPNQLIDFLKDTLTLERADLNLIAKIGKEIYTKNDGASELDAIRLKRASGYVDQLSLSFNELQSILSKKDQWIKVIENVVENFKEEFKKLALSDVSEIVEKVENEITVKKKVLQDLDKNTKSKMAKITQLSKDVSDIELRKNEIVLNLKILAGINEKPQTKITEENPTYFEITANTHNAVYVNVDEFYDELKEKHDFKISNKSEYEDGLLLLKQNNFFVANSSEYVLNLLFHIGKIEVLIQNAEADWLKFDFWKKNGLEILIEKALSNQETKYFYVLQDFNIASFECYGKPIIDVSNKIRKFLFFNDNPFPSNLSIILVSVDEEIEDFGFGINRSTFKNWSFLPNISGIRKIDFPHCDAVDLDKLEVHRNTKDYSENYI